MINLRQRQATERPTRVKEAPFPRPTDGLPLWSSDGVQWGVVRMEGCFDTGDAARHAGIVQHAFPLGRDWLAACGFQPPLQRAFDGVRRPLLAMPGARNPHCPACAHLVVRAVGAACIPGDPGVDVVAWIERRLDPPMDPTGDTRPLRPAVAIPVGRTPEPWPGVDRAPAREAERLRVIEVWRRDGRGEAPPVEAPRVETAGPVGRRAFMEIDRAERIWR